jgi:OmpA-OmpF porin, OOP family
VKKILIATLLSVFALTAFAAPAGSGGLPEMYAGVKVGTSDLPTDPVGFGVYGGYNFSRMTAGANMPLTFGAEAEFTHLGSADYLSGSPGYKTSAYAIGGSGIASLALNPDFSLYGKAGMARVKVSADIDTLVILPGGGLAVQKTSVSNSDFKFTFGIGAQYNINSKFGIRASYDDYGDGSFISIGGIMKF